MMIAEPTKFQTNQQHNLQHIKETGPNLSASPASSTFLLSAATNTTYTVIYQTLYSIIIVGTFSFPFFSPSPSPDRFKVCIGLTTPLPPIKHLQKHHPLFLPKPPLKSVNCQSSPPLGNLPPLYWFFEKLPLKVGFFSEPPEH